MIGILDEPPRSRLVDLNAYAKALGDTFWKNRVTKYLPPTLDCLYGDMTLHEGKWYKLDNRNYWKLELPGELLISPHAEAKTYRRLEELADQVAAELVVATKPYKQILTLGQVPHFIQDDRTTLANVANNFDAVEIRVRALWAGVTP